MTDPRTRIIEAAARCYALSGSRGATTRRIAEEAGVNEITLFRHFGSKEALLDLVVREWGAMQEPPSLPDPPVDPIAELTAWVRHQHEEISKWRTFIRRTLAEQAEHPDAIKTTCDSSTYSSAHLHAYVERLREHGFLLPASVRRAQDTPHACVMLPATLFTDALWRDLMPTMFAGTAEESIAAYVRLFAQGIGLREEYFSSSTAEAGASGDALRLAS
ncbi:MAG: TetR/AcrR family transcriptional regulator [Gemmatimonadaceae bacterium]|jgi:AcrR family transcriptional regulator|nr:TetR/AcrR family transcriptional regulator [Gemmatimonadaceae bacterium]